MMNSNGPQPTKVTAEQWGRKVSIELPHSDTDVNELLDLFKSLALGLGYDVTTWNYGITSMADSILDEELSEEDIDAAFAEHNHLESLDD